MTANNRAEKILQLAKVCDWVDGMRIDDQGYAILTWPAPKGKQFAEIDTRSGEILRFVLQSGTMTNEASVDGYKTMIDRRIAYLVHSHRERIHTAGQKEVV